MKRILHHKIFKIKINYLRIFKKIKYNEAKVKDIIRYEEINKNNIKIKKLFKLEEHILCKVHDKSIYNYMIGYEIDSKLEKIKDGEVKRFQIDDHPELKCLISPSLIRHFKISDNTVLKYPYDSFFYDFVTIFCDYCYMFIKIILFWM